MNDLITPILVSVLASMKESSPGLNGIRLNILWDIPVEVITLLCNLLLKGPPFRGKAGNIFTSRVTFIKKVEVPGDPLEFQPIASRNYFVQVFRVLASCLEVSLPNHGFQHLGGIAHNVLKLHVAISEARSKNENLVVAFVDIHKVVFDLISHKALLGILWRKGVLNLLMNYFSSSRLQMRDLIHPAHCGVKQGEPIPMAV